jgi:hypothetical protein
MTPCKTEEQICSAVYRVGSMEVKAILFAGAQGMMMHYGICLEHEGERGTCDLGTDLMQARKIFFDVVFGGVTACTLQDVIEDRMGTLF